VHWYVDVLKKYATFSGRARRQEYWMFTLFSAIISTVLLIVDAVLGSMGLITMVYALGVFLPSLAVTVRRLHDTDRSGWWLLISLIPFVGTIILLVFLVSDSKPHDSAHGANPKLAPAS
jgi:uncharacterized membrane protein YhaH (DUF805 family)